MEATEIRANVEKILSDAQVTYSVNYVGETTRDQSDGKPWQCDAWRVKFSRVASVQEAPTRARTETFETDYFTGLGHRKPRHGAPSDKGRANTLYREDWEKRWLKPQAPSAADVLHSLVLDAGANDMSFRDWCADCGYSDDSIKALETYRTCCEIGAKLQRIFKRETLDALREAVQEL